jgi:flagellar assembly protein FliH
MSKFKGTEVNVKPGEVKPGDVRVVKLDKRIAPDIKPFQFGTIRKDGEGEYATVKAKFGAMAATDSDRQVRDRRDSRFVINQTVRSGLKLDEEERRVIESRVQERVQAISEQARRTAAEEGHAEGLKSGREQALREFRERTAEKLASFEAMLGEMESAKDRILRENEAFVIETVFRIGRMVLLRELSTDREYVARLAREVIQQMGVRENIRVRVSPADIETAGALKETLGRELGELKNLSIEASASVASGGVQVETEWNAIDASIDTQLQRIHEAISGKSV